MIDSGYRPHRHVLGDIILRLEQSVKFMGDARVGALALRRQREIAPVLVQAKRPQQIGRVLRQEAAGRTEEAGGMLKRSTTLQCLDCATRC